MTLWTGSALPLLALVWPLLLGLVSAVPAVRGRSLSLLPAAPLPALWLAVSGAGTEAGAPDLLLGLVLGAEAAGRVLLGMSALLWTLAGIHARATLGGSGGADRLGAFSGFWCLALAGNLAVFLAADVATFYAGFTAVSLAAWVLVVHDRKPETLAAGRVYLILAVVGEACLLLGLMIGAQAAGGLGVAAVREALGGAPAGTALLVVGFGIKAGMVPLHVWLPLAHPAAPVPASAVLSGAIVKAGVIGMILLLPDGGAGVALVALGLLGAYGAALWGLTQANPKAILAYSTISQVGIVLVLLGTAVGFGEDRLPAALYAAHHGLAKGALFLSVGLVAASGGRWRAAALGLAGLAALSVAGAPLFGGAAAKALAKGALSGWLSTAVTLSGITTTLLLACFLGRLAGGARGTAAPGPALLGPTAALALSALLLPLLLLPGFGGPGLGYLLDGQAVVEAAWPIAAGLALATLLRPGAAGGPGLPPGDLLALLPEWRGGEVSLRLASPDPDAVPLSRRAGEAAARVEGRLLRWRWAGIALVLLVGGLSVLLGPG